MAQNKPGQPAPPKRSLGFNLDSLGSDAAGFLSGFTQVQIRNGAQNLLATRDVNQTGSNVVTTDTGSVRLQSTANTITQATRVSNVLDTINRTHGLAGFWGNLPTPGKVAIIAGPVVIVALVLVVWATRK